MGLIPGRFKKILGVNRGQKRKNKFSFESLEGPKFTHVNKLPLSLNYFCSENDKELLAVSIYSFIRNVGIPKQIRVISDGSIKDLTFIEPLVNPVGKLMLVHWQDFVCPKRHLFGSNFETCFAQAVKYPRLRKTLSLRVIADNQEWYTDSDILFFKGFQDYLPQLLKSEYSFYSPCNDWGCLDSEYLNSEERKVFQVNSGFLIFKGDQNWREPLQYLEKVKGDYQFFDQTTIQVLVDQNLGQILPLDPRKFTATTIDHFKINYMLPDLAFRHYVRPIRHKFWQTAKYEFPELFKR